MKTYVATQRGYIGRIIEPGETFEYEGKPGSWMKPVGVEQAIGIPSASFELIAAAASAEKPKEPSADKQVTDDKAAEKADEKSADKKASTTKVAGKGGK